MPICVSSSQQRLELVGIGHVGHRAAGRKVWQDHLLMRARQDVGALRHEVHAAEHDVVGLGAMAICRARRKESPV